MSFGGMNLGLPCLEETIDEKIDHHYLKKESRECKLNIRCYCLFYKKIEMSPNAS